MLAYFRMYTPMRTALTHIRAYTYIHTEARLFIEDACDKASPQSQNCCDLCDCWVPQENWHSSGWDWDNFSKFVEQAVLSRC